MTGRCGSFSSSIARKCIEMRVACFVDAVQCVSLSLLHHVSFVLSFPDKRRSLV